MTYKEALEKIATVNAMDYEYQAWAREALAQPERPQNCGTGFCSCIECVMEPVAWPCVIETADFEEDTVTLKMQSKDYSVGVGLHWLSTTPPNVPTERQRTWVELTEEDFVLVNQLCKTPLQAAAYTEHLIREKNNA